MSPTQSTASIPARCFSPPLPRATCNQTASSRPPPDPRNACSAKHSQPQPRFPSKPNHALSQSQSPAASAAPGSIPPLQSCDPLNSYLPATHRTKTPLAQLHSLRQTLSVYAKSPYKSSIDPLATNPCCESACQSSAALTAAARHESAPRPLPAPCLFQPRAKMCSSRTCSTHSPAPRASARPDARCFAHTSRLRSADAPTPRRQKILAPLPCQ